MTTNPAASLQAGKRDPLPLIPNRGVPLHNPPGEYPSYVQGYEQGQGQGQVQIASYAPHFEGKAGKGSTLNQKATYQNDYYGLTNNGDQMTNQSQNQEFYAGYNQGGVNSYHFEGHQQQQQQQFNNNNNNNNNGEMMQQHYFMNTASANGVGVQVQQQQQQQQQKMGGQYDQHMYEMQGGLGEQGQGQGQGKQYGGAGGDYVAECWDTPEQVEQQFQRMQIREQPVPNPMYFSPNKLMPSAQNGNVEQDFPQDVVKRQQALDIKLENVDQEIVRALRDPKNTKTVLAYESQVIEFVNNQVLPFMEFEENSNSYLKLLAHRIAQRFGLHTTTQKLGDKRGFVKAERTPETGLPKYLLVDILNEMQMLQYPNDPPSPTNNNNGSIPTSTPPQMQQYQQQHTQYALLQRRNFSEPVTPRGRNYMMQPQQQQQDVGDQQQEGGMGVGGGGRGGLWQQGKTAAARNEMYDQVKERIFSDKDDQEQQQGGQEPRTRTKAILKNKQEEKMDPDYQRQPPQHRYKNKQFDMGRMQAEYYNTPIAYDPHFPPLAQDMTAHRSPSWPLTTQDSINAQTPHPNQFTPQHYYYHYPPHMQHYPPHMPQPPYQTPALGQYMAAYPMGGGGGGAGVGLGVGGPYVTSPFQGPPPVLIDAQGRKLSNDFIAQPNMVPQQSPALYVPAQVPGWNQHQLSPSLVGYSGINQGGMQLGGRKQVFKKNQMAQLPAEIDGAIDHQMLPLKGDDK